MCLIFIKVIGVYEIINKYDLYFFKEFVGCFMLDLVLIFDLLNYFFFYIII